jgi:uncharacterized protein
MLPLGLFAIFMGAASMVASAGGAQPTVGLFELKDVRLLEGPFRHAQELNERYLLAHDVDRLLSPYRTEAGLPPRAPKYPNWESTGLEGHTAGHYLTALAQAIATGGDAEMKRRLDHMIAELAACQQANGDGYVGAVPGSKEFWADVAAGRISAEGFSIGNRWVPWYNIHKLYAGLRDAWRLANHPQARDVLIALADWCDRLVSGLTDEQMQIMLRAEHGGMNEVLADVYAITGDEKYLGLAKRFSHRAILDPLLQHEDRLTGLHANTQIPKVIGFARIAALDSSGETGSWAEAARFFWSTVVDRRSVAFGGNSVREHFNPPDNFSSMLESREGPETCNTYNMLRLTEQLFQSSPEPHYADYYERALFNHILSSQHPRHGGFVYFTPIRPQHYRVYSQPEQCFWCCVGSGMENHGKYGQFIYAHRGDELLVNLFLASELAWKAKGVSLRQETRFPDEPATRLTVATRNPQRFTLAIRHPAWVAAGELAVRVNGQRVPLQSVPRAYGKIEREWHDGDRVEIELPMRTRLERLPDGSDYVAVLHGPLVLAAKTDEADMPGLIAGDGRMAHVSPGPYRPLETAPMLVGEEEALAASIRPVAGKPLTFTAHAVIRPEQHRDVELVPFARVHDARYVMYWRTVTPEGYTAVVENLARKEQVRLELEARTLDAVAPGEQQPEVEHRFAGEDSRTGSDHGRHWRDAGRWFGYDLRSEPGVPVDLIVTYAAWERGRKFDLEVNGHVIASVELEGRDQDRFVDAVYSIPHGIGRAAEGSILRVRFVAKDGARTASVYGVRLVRRLE